MARVSRRVEELELAPGERVNEVVMASQLGISRGPLREAIRNGQQVLLDCVEADGTSGRHTIWPISMAGGMVRGHEPATSRLASFPLHRLTSVSVIDDEAEGP